MRAQIHVLLVTNKYNYCQGCLVHIPEIGCFTGLLNFLNYLIFVFTFFWLNPISVHPFLWGANNVSFIKISCDFQAYVYMCPQSTD